MNKLKKLCIVLISCVLCSSALSLAACSSNTSKSKPIIEGDLKFYEQSDGTYSIRAANTNITGTLTIPSTFNGKAVTSIRESAFNGCNNITQIHLPASIQTIGHYSLVPTFGCEKLESFTVDENNNYFSSYKGILFNKEQTSIVESPVNLQGEIELPDTMTRVTRSAFTNCTSLTSVIIPDSVTAIEGGAFSNCTSLTNITLSNNLTVISDSVFVGCASLTSIKLSDSVKLIGNRAFTYCRSLSSIIYEGTSEQWQAIKKGKEAIPDTITVTCLGDNA